MRNRLTSRKGCTESWRGRMGEEPPPPALYAYDLNVICINVRMYIKKKIPAELIRYRLLTKISGNAQIDWTKWFSTFSPFANWYTGVYRESRKEMGGEEPMPPPALYAYVHYANQTKCILKKSKPSWFKISWNWLNTKFRQFSNSLNKMIFNIVCWPIVGSGDENHIVMNERVQALAGNIYEVSNSFYS